jgi:hypothetical protein
MKGKENLKPQSQRTKAEQRQVARQGGIASGKARKEKKELKDRIKLAFEIAAAQAAKKHPEQAKELKEIGFDVFVLKQMVENPDASDDLRLKTMAQLWDRAYGKPQQPVEMSGDLNVVTPAEEQALQRFMEKNNGK